MIQSQTIKTSTRSGDEFKNFHVDRNVEASKSIISVVIGICVVWLIIIIALKINSLIIPNITATVILIISYFLHYKSYHLSARVLFFTASNTLLFVSILIIGSSMNIDLIMISEVGLIFLMFNYPDDKIWILYCFSLVLLNVFTQWCLDLYDFESYIILRPEIVDYVALFSLITSFLVLFIVLIKFMKVFAVFEDTVFNLTETKIQLAQAEKMVSLGQLTAGVAHELNNPINIINASIVGIERNLEKTYELIDAYEESIDKSVSEYDLIRINELIKDLNSIETRKLMFDVIRDVKIGAKRTAEIVSSLMNYSRFKNEEKVMVNVIDSINETLLLAKYIIKPKIIIVKEFDTRIDSIHCYGYEMNQVFMNLILNAEHAIEEEGTIIIRVENLEKIICITIKDDGCGMDDKTKKQIFNPFFTTKSIGAGTGLGLSISYEIVNKNGGSIIVKSELGFGSEFIVHLPKTFD